MARRVLTAVAVIMTACILLTMFAGCNKEKTPEEEFSSAKKEVVAISTTENFYCFKEFLQNVVLKEEGINVDELFIKIDNDNIRVHVLSNAGTYTVYTVEAKQNNEVIAEAITSEESFIYLASHDAKGNETFIQRPFNESIWNSYYYVEDDCITLEI